jgi:NADH-dependent peroxiredoxin subunit C
MRGEPELDAGQAAQLARAPLASAAQQRLDDDLNAGHCGHLPAARLPNRRNTMQTLINTQVQPFKAQAFHNGKFIEVTEKSLKGKWSVLIFMPAAFTFNCPTEIEDAADNYAEFQKAGAEVYIVTTDTHFSHKVWHETSAAVGKAKFPLVGDPTHALTNAFGVHIPEEGLALRGTFVINPDGVIKTMEVHSNEIARDVSETLRKLKAAQYTAAHPNEVCPAKWKDGAATLTPSLDLVGKI